jgi:hypothetical protein
MKQLSVLKADADPDAHLTSSVVEAGVSGLKEVVAGSAARGAVWQGDEHDEASEAGAPPATRCTQRKKQLHAAGGVGGHALGGGEMESDILPPKGVGRDAEETCRGKERERERTQRERERKTERTSSVGEHQERSSKRPNLTGGMAPGGGGGGGGTGGSGGRSSCDESGSRSLYCCFTAALLKASCNSSVCPHKLVAQGVTH